MSSTIRLYFPDRIQSDLSSHLTNEQTHYLKDVMRLKIGDKLSIFNTSGEWNAVVENYEKKGVKIKIIEKTGSVIIVVSPSLIKNVACPIQAT